MNENKKKWLLTFQFCVIQTNLLHDIATFLCSWYNLQYQIKDLLSASFIDAKMN